MYRQGLRLMFTSWCGMPRGRKMLSPKSGVAASVEHHGQFAFDEINCLVVPGVDMDRRPRVSVASVVEEAECPAVSSPESRRFMTMPARTNALLSLLRVVVSFHGRATGSPFGELGLGLEGDVPDHSTFSKNRRPGSERPATSSTSRRQPRPPQTRYTDLDAGACSPSAPLSQI